MGVRAPVLPGARVDVADGMLAHSLKASELSRRLLDQVQIEGFRLDRQIDFAAELVYGLVGLSQRPSYRMVRVALICNVGLTYRPKRPV